MVNWYGHPWSEVVRELNSNIYYGLDEDQIELCREKHGENKIVMPSTKGLFYLMFVQFKEIWIVFLILSIAIFIYLGVFVYAIASAAIIFLNILCAALERYKEEKNIKELQKLNLGRARVIRDGRTVKIPSEEVVVGDIVIVGRGEGIPADIRIIESNELKVDECSVTGESFISEKYESKIEDKELLLSDMKNILFKSSSVVAGDGTGIVVAVGMNTEVANMVKLLIEEGKKKKSFGFRLHKIFNIFTLISIGLLSAVQLILTFMFHENFYNNLKELMIIFLSSFPQVMIIIILLSGIILFKKLAKKHIFFKDLSSLEKLSRVSAVCTDKVGAFAKNRMEIVKAYDSNGFIDANEEVLKDSMGKSLYKMLNIGILCNDIKSIKGTVENSKENLVELALVRFGQQNGINKKELDKKNHRILQILFDSERRIMTTVNKVNKKYRANVKGAPDSIILRCTHILKNGLEVEITDEDIKIIKDWNISMSNECLYVVGFAYRNFNYEPSIKENIESNLVFVGLIGFDNMLKENAVDSVKKALALSIRPIIITEDNKLTALAIGKKLKIVSRLQQIVSGVEMDNMTDSEFERIGEKVNLFSRINSKHKVKMVKALKGYGYVSAITGWKLTDLPALKIADVGITNTKSKIVRRLCDIFTDNMDFMSLLNTIEDSRKIMKVFKKIIVYIISCSVGFLTFLMGSFLFNFHIVNSIIIESFWFNSILMFLSVLALICQYKDEGGDYIYYSIDRSIIMDNLTFIISAGFLMGTLACMCFYICNLYRGEFDFLTSVWVLNTCAAIFSYSFSNKKFFVNKVSNWIIGINIFIQFIIVLFTSNFTILFNTAYLKIFLICILLWLIICMFYKFQREEFV
ncbi:cation-transporting P-type ATPase [Clostridium sp. WILCCON 0269]|uniref:Cation-transporting P-type ATPase n=1 Tax=Candidatus Clostridium eludens TaxID=3381663 RepID=A0ABW8SIE5_9CLOT